MTLADAGFFIEAVCPRGHFLAATSAVKKLHRYGALRGVSSLRSAILKANPTIVIPCDELARNHLHHLYEDERADSQDGEICKLIHRSLGDPLSYQEVESRSRLLAVVREEGAAAVETTVISSSSHLKDWLAVNGFPAVLKTDGSSGGYGVRVVSSVEDAEVAFRKLSAPPSLAKAIKRALVNRNQTFLLPAWKRVSATINVQKFIHGIESTSTAVCWRGTVLAALTFEVLRAMYPGGPATVVRLLKNQAIDSTIQKIAARLGLSGICGFDFILENGTAIPHLIELNPRATQTAHLRLGRGRDIANSLFAAVMEKCTREPVNEIKNDTIALFPQEWIREPESEFLKSAFQDVPWNEPDLLEAIVASEGKKWKRIFPSNLQSGGSDGD
jgi:glutathione synthase/RimK-type ligase-like ATP-grasp enzyme